MKCILFSLKNNRKERLECRLQQFALRFHLYHSLGKFSRRQTDDIFSYLTQKTGFNISFNLHEMSKLFPGKIRKNISKCHLLKFLPTVLSNLDISPIRSFNLYHSLGWFSRWQIDEIFLFFPRKQDLTFYANCLHWRQFACNVKSCFLGKIKIFQIVICWNFYPVW